MDEASRHALGEGPFRADQLNPKDPYELSHGHPIYCAPTGSRGGGAALAGGTVLATDPEVESVGFDVGFSPEPGMLRAPDLSVGNVGDGPGWARGVPALAVEYADTGQDEAGLQDKIQELLAAGTRLIWVVRLIGPRRVEVYEPGTPVRLVDADGSLSAPGILANAVPVAALYDRGAAMDAALSNLLQRQGYQSLDDVRDEGREEGRQTGREEGRQTGREEGRQTGREETLAALREVCVTLARQRLGALSPSEEARVASLDSVPRLQALAAALATASDANEGRAALLQS